MQLSRMQGLPSFSSYSAKLTAGHLYPPYDRFTILYAGTVLMIR